MEHAITPSESGALVEALEGQGIGEMLKPLIREIHLFDSFIAGTALLKDPSVLKKLKEGDCLTLLREDNRFDDHAILILNEEKEKLGYVPEKDNVVFARLMDAGKMLTAKVIRIEVKGSFLQIAIGIYLTDF